MLRCEQGGRTPLYEACSRGHIDVARLLIAEGAYAALLDNNGRSALSRVRDVAVRANLEQAVEDYRVMKECMPVFK